MNIALDIISAQPALFVAPVLVYLFNALAINWEKPFWNWENAYFGLFLTVSSGSFLIVHVYERYFLLLDKIEMIGINCDVVVTWKNINYCTLKFFDLIYTTGTLITGFLYLFIYASIFAIQVYFRRRFQNVAPPMNYIVLAGISNILGFGAYVLFIRIVNATI